MTLPTPYALPPETVQPQRLSSPILVWHQPKLLYLTMVIVLGLAVPGLILHITDNQLGTYIALPVACVATFIGLVWIESRSDPVKSRGIIVFIFLSVGGCLVLAIGLLFLLIEPHLSVFVFLYGLLYGLPWAIWVSITTANYMMTWRKPT